MKTSQDQVKTLLYLYIQGRTVNEIIELTSMKKSTIRYQLLKLGQKLPKKGLTKQKVKFNPFAENTETSNYWLGYLIADGNVSRDSNGISISTVSDPEHILKYRDWINPTLKLNKRLNSNNKYCISVTFGNKEVKEYLINLGITPKKSKTLFLKFPLNPPLLRGIFDGDGSCINQYKITTGSSYFRDQLLEYLRENNIDCYYKSKTSKSECFDVLVRAKDKAKFFNLLYNNSTVKLERKYNTFRLALEKSRVRKVGELRESPVSILDNPEPSADLNDQ